ncbi:DUF4097 family beta strand repeat-containing protein [Isoptericola jiangsuensis]|uniref:DUF4097 family beta strand repeat-containing protein n=1 Tax=Isoptericola jiangsuensis TaxID=548579 RepID=UPI003AAE619C
MSTETWAVAAPQTITVDGVSAVSVRVQAGRVDVVVDPETTRTTLDVTEISEKPLQVTRDRDRLRIGYEASKMDAFVARVKNLGSSSERAVLRLTVPPGTAVDVGTVEGDADVTGTTGTVVKTVTGTVRTAGTSGSLYLKSVSGDVAATAHSGDVSAQVVSGALAVDGAIGRVSAHSVSGALAVTAVGTTPMVTVKTVSGDVTVRLDEGTPVSLKVRGAAGQAILDGTVLPSTGRVLAVDHADTPVAGRSVAYLTAAVTSSRVVVTRG